MFFQKNEYFWGYVDLVDIFGGHHKTGLVLGVISMHFRVFSYGQGTEWEYFILGGGGVVLKNKYFWGMPDIPDIFGGR